MHGEPGHQNPDIERDTQARIEPVYSEIPSGNIARIRSSSVVVVLQGCNLRFSICGHSTISRVKRFCHIIVDTQCSVQKPLLGGRVHSLTHTHATERILWQKKSTVCQRCYRASPKQQKVAPGPITQDPRSDLNYRKRALFKEALPVFRGDRFDGNGWSRFVGSRFEVHAIDLWLILHSR